MFTKTKFGSAASLNVGCLIRGSGGAEGLMRGSVMVIPRRVLWDMSFPGAESA